MPLKSVRAGLLDTFSYQVLPGTASLAYIKWLLQCRFIIT